MTTILINMSRSSRTRVLRPPVLERLQRLGSIVEFDPDSSDASSFQSLLESTDVMITSWGSRPLSDSEWQPRTKPLLVAHGAGSIRHLIPKALLEKGLRLTHSPLAIAPAVAQFSVGLMILALRQTMARTTPLRSGARFSASATARGLDGQSVGLIGLSQVGQRVPPLLAPFGCHILAYDPYWDASHASELGVTLVAELDELISRSDVLSLHAPVTAETTGMIDAYRIGLLEAGSAVINTARPALIDQDALFQRAFDNELQVYLDVTTPEPLPPSHPAFECPNIFITPHIAGLSDQTDRRIGEHVADEVERYLRGEPLRMEVTPGRYELLA